MLRIIVGFLVCALSNFAGAQDVISDTVGATQGAFRVDESGQATYRVPIYTPPGTAGVAPEMGISYSSQASSGPLGRGFNIAGQSAITRCRQTREHGDALDPANQPLDSYAPEVNFSPTDRFCLDGQRLLVTAGVYGAPSAEYRPELDPFTKVISRGGVNSTSAYSGPQSFEVYRRDGSLATYGGTLDSRLNRNRCEVGDEGCANRVLNWQLSRMQDSTGNYIDYTYLLDPGGQAGEQLLRDVLFTGKIVLPGQSGSAQAPYARVRFNYEALDSVDQSIGFQAGSQFSQTQALTSITVSDQVQATPVDLRHYQLTYGVSNSNSRARILASLRECRDATLAVCLAPTQFNWAVANTTLQAGVNQNLGLNGFDEFKGYKLGDIDGDGRTDIVWWKGGTASCGSGRQQLTVSFADLTSAGQITFTRTEIQAALQPV